MVRTQIQLTEEQAEKLREIAMKNRESIASLIRSAIDQFLLSGKDDRSSLYAQARLVVGKYKTDKDDIAVEHDKYLNEDYIS
jgi:predicted DNA-binding ribbon-helix-helix protein